MHDPSSGYPDRPEPCEDERCEPGEHRGSGPADQGCTRVAVRYPGCRGREQEEDRGPDRLPGWALVLITPDAVARDGSSTSVPIEVVATAERPRPATAIP